MLSQSFSWLMLWTSLCDTELPTFLSVGALVSLMKARCFASGENKHFGEQEQLACNMTPAASRMGEFSQLQPFLAAAAKSLQSCPTLCDPIDGSPPGSPIPGILQARTLEWVAISFSNVWKWSCSVVSDSQRPYGLQPTRLLRPWDFPGNSTGVGCRCLLCSLSLGGEISFREVFPGFYNWREASDPRWGSSCPG